MKTRKILSFVLALVMIVTMIPMTIPVSAATSGKPRNCTWTLDGTVLTISGNGAMKDYS